MSNPLNEQIADLLSEIEKLEAERDRQEKSIEYRYPLSTQTPDVIERIRPTLEIIDRLTRTVDAKRQQVISLELLMLDNSIKDVHSIMRQVDGSIESLQGTTKEVLKSSTQLERLTFTLIFLTILLGIIGFYQAAITLSPNNPYAALIGAVGVPILILVLLLRFGPRLSKARQSQDN